MAPGFDGNTAVYGVIGDPVSHSLSPQIHKYFADLCNVNMAYVPFHVKDLGSAIGGAHALGIRGLNVTVPHKKSIMPHILECDDMAKKIDAVNTLVWMKSGYTGHNTDYTGIQRTAASMGISFRGRCVAVLGAGGSAYAAAIAAADGQAKQIMIINRTLESAFILASHVNSHYNIPIEVENPSFRPEIIIQATTVGFGRLEGKSPVDLDFFKGAEMAFDLIYTPWETEFLRQAKEAGVPKIVNGFPMLVYQAAAAFCLWHGPDSISDEEVHVKNLQGLLCNEKN